MRKLLLATVLLATPPLHSQARLGETEAQLIERFGKPRSKAVQKHIAQGQFLELCPKLTFRQGDWTIVVDLIDGKSAREHYSKKGDWTKAQFNAVLDANAQGGRWSDFSKPDQARFFREWRRRDGAVTKWQFASKWMVVTHPSFEKAKRKLEAQAKRKASKIPKF